MFSQHAIVDRHLVRIGLELCGLNGHVSALEAHINYLPEEARRTRTGAGTFTPVVAHSDYEETLRCRLNANPPPESLAEFRVGLRTVCERLDAL